MPPRDAPLPSFGTHPPRICRERGCDMPAIVGSNRCPRHVHLDGAAPQGERVVFTDVEPPHDEDTQPYYAPLLWWWLDEDE